jgi:hypothetical protein
VLVQRDRSVGAVDPHGAHRLGQSIHGVTAPERICPAEPLPELDAVSVGVADFRPFGTSEIILLWTEGTYCELATLKVVDVPL